MEKNTHQMGGETVSLILCCVDIIGGVSNQTTGF